MGEEGATDGGSKISNLNCFTNPVNLCFNLLDRWRFEDFKSHAFLLFIVNPCFQVILYGVDETTAALAIRDAVETFVIQARS